MSIVLSSRAAKLMRLCAANGYETYEDFVRACALRTVCPAICMTDGCEHISETECNQSEGRCEACGGNTLVSLLVLVGLHVRTSK